MTVPYKYRWPLIWLVAFAASLVVATLLNRIKPPRPTLEDRVEALEAEADFQREQMAIMETEIDALRGQVYGNSMDLEALFDHTPIGEYVERCLSLDGCQEEEQCSW